MANNRVTWWQWIIIFAVVFGIGVLIGYYSHRNEPIYRDVLQIDTLYQTDTITQIKPIFVDRKTIDSIEVKVEVHDTIEKVIQLPREERTYKDTTYKAIVSGYEPSLDFIEIYQQTKYITEKEYIKPKRWGFSVQLGTGVLYDIPRNQFGVGVYGGVGIYYRF